MNRQPQQQKHLLDSLSREIQLLEQAPVIGRKKELRQLLKLLHLAKTGQTKSVLINGDKGIGKTALLDSFKTIVNKALYCRTISLEATDIVSPEHLCISILNKLRQECAQILDEALVAVNTQTTDIGMQWDRLDLIRAVSLVKIQEGLPNGVDGRGSTQHEKLMKAIRSSVPTVKKLKMSVNDTIENLVGLVTNPWVMAAASILEPVDPKLRAIYEKLEQQSTIALPPEEGIRLFNQRHEDNDNNNVSTESNDTETKPEIPKVKLNRGANMHPDADAAIDSLFESRELSIEEMVKATEIKLGRSIEALPSPVKNTDHHHSSEHATRSGVSHVQIENKTRFGNTSRVAVPADPDYLNDVVTNSIVDDASSNEQNLKRNTLPPKLDADVLSDEASLNSNEAEWLNDLLYVVNHVNHFIEDIETALFVSIDGWDKAVTSIESRAKQINLKRFFAHFMQQTVDKRNFHFMLLLSCTTENQSQTLGGTIYPLFRNKLLLSPLSPPNHATFIRQRLKEAKLTVTDDVLETTYNLTLGNPYWNAKIIHALLERSRTNHVSHIDNTFYRRLGVENLTDILEMAFTRLKLISLDQEPNLYKVIAALLNNYGTKRFSTNKALKEISLSQHVSETFVFEVLRQLYNQHFLVDVSNQNKATSSNDNNTPLFNSVKDETRLKYYRIESATVFDFLKEKTRHAETDISTDEKLAYLRGIIPLSIRSGELSREKTQEVIQLCHTLNDTSMVQFIEDALFEYFDDSEAVVRVNVLNNLALMHSDRSREAILHALRDSNPLVREYASRNLKELSEKNTPLVFKHRIVESMIGCIDDDSDLVRTQVYQTLSDFRDQHELTAIFLKGMNDACEHVRLVSVESLLECESNSPYLRTAFTDACRDPHPEIRKYGCMGIRRYQGSDIVRLLSERLQEDEDNGIRAIAADALCMMEDDRALQALVQALNQPVVDSDPMSNYQDVKLAIVRSLGKAIGWRSEEILLDYLESTLEAQRKRDNEHDYDAAVVWATVRSIGKVASTQRSLHMLNTMLSTCQNEFIINALEQALQAILFRVENLRSMENQLSQASTTIFAETSTVSSTTSSTSSNQFYQQAVPINALSYQTPPSANRTEVAVHAIPTEYTQDIASIPDDNDDLLFTTPVVTLINEVKENNIRASIKDTFTELAEAVIDNFKGQADPLEAEQELELQEKPDQTQPIGPKDVLSPYATNPETNQRSFFDHVENDLLNSDDAEELNEPSFVPETKLDLPFESRSEQNHDSTLDELLKPLHSD